MGMVLLEVMRLPRLILRSPYPVDEVIHVAVKVTQMRYGAAVGIFDAAFGMPGALGAHQGVAYIARSLVEVEVGKRGDALARAGVGHQFPPLADLVTQIDSRKYLPSVIRIVIDIGTGAEQQPIYFFGFELGIQSVVVAVVVADVAAADGLVAHFQTHADVSGPGLE